MDGSTSIPKCHASRGTYKKEVDANSLKWYPVNVQNLLIYAWHTLANNMVNNLGWLYGETAHHAYKDSIHEAFSEANTVLHEQVQLTCEMQTVILKEPSYVYSKAVEYAEKYVKTFFVTDDAELLNDPLKYQAWMTNHLDVISDHKKPTFFFNEHDATGNVV
ncbi:hypothetical protein JVT61DRAFT_7838 [Boletus reticuloceps]|uniref:Uncharacterized protein n=1 Tax=Boletus reticuloceps TaxID=495285 RepID=A0A8I2YIS3_9AGAM|nr:hypothetical protein JVT61DRAFT_7838 [Boletus reticuloceps]